MTSQPGTPDQPLRIAIIGSGPSGFYAADALLKQTDLNVQVDMYDRLPTPYGLVRGGVAPDHPKIKTVTKVYDRTADDPRFRFYGNVELGRDITHDELLNFYHQIIYATGAQTDRKMGIPGEDLVGSYPATEFVGWYNAHPDYRDLTFDLSQERVAVVGNGNVAMDVIRILASTYEELAATDIADYALEALRNSKVKEIYVLGRRGPAQAAYTNPELKELGELAGVDVIVAPADAAVDPLSAADMERNPDRIAEKNVELLQEFSNTPPSGKPRKIIMRFLVSPIEIIGTDHVEAVKIVKNELVMADDGTVRPRATDKTEILPVGLIFRSIGYRGVKLPGVAFDDRNGVITNIEGRVIDTHSQLPQTGEYVVGWIKRGPSGIIGTNKPDSVATVNGMLADAKEGLVNPATQPTRAAVEAFVEARQPDVVSFPDWRLLDQAEVARGAAVGRPRIKFSRIPDMIAAIKEKKGVPSPSGD